jgi:hypothetical protein
VCKPAVVMEHPCNQDQTTGEIWTRSATRSPTIAPSLQPTRCAGPPTAVSRNAIVSCAIASKVIGPATSGVCPWPRRSGVYTWNRAASGPMFGPNARASTPAPPG